MAATIKETEATPGAWPATPSGLSAKAAALEPAMIWGRLEAWTAWRWSSRAVVWIAEGPGEWVPPLSPATIATVEGWTGSAWAAVTLNRSPLGGYDLPAEGPYRFTGTAGGGTLPEAVAEAFRRLAEYSAEGTASGGFNGLPGASSGTFALGEGMSKSFDRAPTWLARAMVNSGAADLLRPYRRA